MVKDRKLITRISPQEGRTVTAIEVQRSGRSRANVFLDGRFAFSLSLAVIQEAGLRTGQRLSEGEIEKLVGADLFGKALGAALGYLSYRPRSEAELRDRLHRRKFDDDIIEGVIFKLKEGRLLDDAAFAQFWRENRETFSPRSQRLLKLELRQKGVDTQTVDEVVAGLDDDPSAYRAAQKKLRTLARLDYQSFRRRLGAFLKGRGFNYEVISHTVNRMWQEREQG